VPTDKIAAGTTMTNAAILPGGEGKSHDFNRAGLQFVNGPVYALKLAEPSNSRIE
jgi:hypothetical protein